MWAASLRGRSTSCIGLSVTSSTRYADVTLNLRSRLRTKCSSSRTSCVPFQKSANSCHTASELQHENNNYIRYARYRNDQNQWFEFNSSSIPFSTISSSSDLENIDEDYDKNEHRVSTNRRTRRQLNRMLKREFRAPYFQQIRCVATSTTAGGPQNKDSPLQNPGKEEQASNSANTTKDSVPTESPMDADFQTYLSGSQEKTEAEENRLKLAAAAGRRLRSKAAILGGNNDKEQYEQVLRVSLMQKEESRIRTATNVHRALCGNVVICLAKLGAWMSSGSSAMLAEFVHSVVDVGNQSLLLIGLRDSRLAPDGKHPYGYGKSVYFWALVSALGTFFLGAGISMTHAVGNLMHPSLDVITWEVWAVLGFSFAVDGYVFVQTVRETYASKPAGMSYWKHVNSIRDPATLAVLLEDGAACLGIVMAMGGIAMTHATDNPVFDAMAGVAISSLLGAMGVALARVNHRFLLGQAVDKEITEGIKTILENQRSIDSIRSVQSQWTGPDTFSYKAEVDFDGTYLAARLMPIYQVEFEKIQNTMDSSLQVLLAFYAEDVMRTVEREVRHVEFQIRKKYPGAEYIELEPMSVNANRLAIDDNLEGGLRRVETDSLNLLLKSFKSDENLLASSPETEAEKK